MHDLQKFFFPSLDLEQLPNISRDLFSLHFLQPFCRSMPRITRPKRKIQKNRLTLLVFGLQSCHYGNSKNFRKVRGGSGNF